MNATSETTLHAVVPPEFVMWRSMPPEGEVDWRRRWFGGELNPAAGFTVRGIGIREPMFNADVHRPRGTGDWLIMFFHQPARLQQRRAEPSVGGNTLILWPPAAPQFYSWGHRAGVEPHSWMHIEGTWVSEQVTANGLPVSAPLLDVPEQLVVPTLDHLMAEMIRFETADQVILRNLFENWARALGRHLRTEAAGSRIPSALLRVRDHLDRSFTEPIVLDKLAAQASMSRSHLCHQFRKVFGCNISSHVIRRRMSIAERLLLDDSKTITAIGTEVGYADVFQFSKQFKKTFGMSPSQYRKKQIATVPRSTPVRAHQG